MGVFGSAAGARYQVLNQNDQQGRAQAQQNMELRQRMFSDLLSMNAQKQAAARQAAADRAAELRQALEDKRFQLSQDQFGEAQRHNRATEANAAAVTAGGGANKAPSDTQLKNGMLADIAIDAEPRISEAGNSIANSTLAKIPIIGNALVRHTSKEYQAAKQAANQLSEAWLRLTSGATITDADIAHTTSTFLPEPGDDPETLKRKAHARMVLLVGMKKAAGRAPTNPLPSETSNKNDVPGNITLDGDNLEQQKAYDRAALQLRKQGKDPASILGPRP